MDKLRNRLPWFLPMIFTEKMGSDSGEGCTPTMDQRGLLVAPHYSSFRGNGEHQASQLT